MTRSLYSKFILGYLIFGLLGFTTIATFSSRMTRDYLMRERRTIKGPFLWTAGTAAGHRL